MSNKKVEQRKQDKYSRKKGPSTNKLKTIGGISLAVVIVCAVIVFFAYQIDQSYFAFDRIESIDLEEMSTAVSNVQSVNVSGDAQKDTATDGSDASKDSETASQNDKDNTTSEKATTTEKTK